MAVSEKEESPVSTPRPGKKGEWTVEENSAYWRARRTRQKLRRKTAAAQKREEKRKEWEQLGVEEQERRRAAAKKVLEERRAAEANAHVLCEQHLADTSLPVLVFDLSFAWCMTPSSCRSTVLQMKFAYSALRRHAFPLRPVITSICGQETKGESEQGEILRCLREYEGFRRYPVPIHEEHWSSLYAKERVVFLTADTDDVLERLESDTVYVVGAFVDHNTRKFLTRDAARRHGVRMARLPLEESIEVGNRRKVLTVDHVVAVLCRYAECSDWRRAFDVLPTRCAGKTKRKPLCSSTETKGASSSDAATVLDEEEGRSHDDGTALTL